MYDRAPRQVSDQLVGSTPQNVGPGTYEAKVSAVKTTGCGYAPFLSLAQRKTIFNIESGDGCAYVPGPGTYEPRNAQPHVKGGRTLANKERRFTDTEAIKEDTPGPGNYNVKTGFEKTLVADDEEVKVVADRTNAKKLVDAVDSKGESVIIDTSITKSGRPQKILTASLRSDINAEGVPSIPSPGKAHGYLEKSTGQLVKQRGQRRDKTMGPAYYNPNHTEQKTTKKYKGVHFGVMTAKRVQFKGRTGPAPCDYEPYQSSWENLTNKEKLGVSGDKIFESRLPRYHQIVTLEEEKRGVPGPGRYDINSQFTEDEAFVSEKCVEAKKKRPAFGQQELRFNGHGFNGPAPGAYNDPRNALECLKKISGMKHSPFGQTSIRFRSDTSRSIMMNNTPGPGSYNMLNYGLSSNSRKKASKSSKHGGFGSTSVRIAPMITKDSPDVPGPAHYGYKDTKNTQNVEEFRPPETSAFASHTERLEAPTTRTRLENPPPGSYEVAFAYEKTQTKSSTISKPRSRGAYLRQRSFLSSAPRFGKMNIYMPGQLPVDPQVTVSAASYKPKNTDKSKLALLASRDQRFKMRDIQTDAPGPGTYHLSPLIDSTVLKGTYNVTLNNPVPKQRSGETLRKTDTSRRPNTTPSITVH